jgi:NAD(P)-dependent dehydrogenase (short-subunit alcohol dehydrogenase family)/radical SAM superfamily enzyme YgiQ (UPF0313 family)/Tfp pilus assembly protein PilF
MRTRTVNDVDPAKWREHLYGLTPERWASLRGKSFWVTGAGSGYGRCIACGLAAAGAQVFLTGRRTEKLKESIQEISSLGIPTENCHIVKADITNSNNILTACDQVKSLCYALHGLVNNAALPTSPGTPNPLQVGSLEYWNKMIATNVTAPWLITRTIFPHMLASGQVRVLFISSEAGWASTPGLGDYNISKAALNSLSHSLAQEYANTFPEKDIQINTLIPGEARTEMNRASTQSPYAVVSMTLILLSHPKGGPNGRFFHRDGRHFQFGYTTPYEGPLIWYQTTASIQQQVAEELISAKHYYESGNLKDALDISRQILATNPNNSDALHLFGTIAFHVGKYDTAISYIKKAIKNDPAVSQFHNDMGVVLNAQGKLNDAIGYFQEALRLKPNSVESHLNLGTMFMLRRDFNVAVEHFQEAILLEPNNPEVHIKFGMLFMKQKKIEAAINYFHKATLLNPNSAEAFFNLGFLLHSQGKFDAAIQQYQKALQLNSDYWEKARINISNASNRFSPIERRFMVNLCLLYDNNEDDQQCLDVLGKILIDKGPNLAFYGTGRLCRYMFEQVPALKFSVKFIIEDDSSLQGTQIEGIPVGSLGDLPESVQTVFLCSTRYLEIVDMERRLMRLQRNIESCSLSVIEEVNPSVIPARAWKEVGTIYPIEIPEIEFLPGQDLILLDLPARMQAQMPNGLAYVHDILKTTGIRFQTMDLDIIFYHRYHAHRVLDGLEQIVAPSGYIMKTDPWDVGCFTEEWEKPEVIEFFRPEINRIIRGLIEARPKIIGISLHGTNILIARDVIKGVRKEYPEVIILVGGYDCTYHYVAPHKFPEFDFMCIHEADLTLGPLIKSLVAGEKPKDLPGVLSKHDSPSRKWEPAPLLTDLDSIPFPRYDWTGSLELYRNYNGYWLTPILTTRGCYWSRCTFCAERFAWRKRSPERVVDELEWLMEQRAYLFHFNDSDLNGDPKTVLAICDEIIRRNLKPQLVGQLRIDKQNTPEFFQRLRAAGFSHLRFGVDGWTNHVLRLQKKGYTMKMVGENLRNCFEAGIIVTVNVVIGVPGETDEDIQEMIDNMIQLKPYIHIVENIHSLMLAAGSQYYLEPEKYNIHFRGDKEDIYAQNPHMVPPHLWYSEEPYIDNKVRGERLRSFCAALYESGMNIGPFARTMVKKLSGEIEDAIITIGV